MKKFEIPIYYQSSIISRIKKIRTLNDSRKKDYSPTMLDFGPVRFFIARHFGFCYGVENAIEIAYKTIAENPGKRIFLLSEMIHNPGVNNDLLNLHVKFIMDTSGNQIIDWDEISNEDIVIIPAFGTTLEIEKKLNEKGINPYKYDTTCPFVEKVWNRSASLGDEGSTIIIHGKYSHEETRATFSHSKESSPTLIVRDMKETEFLASVILNKKSKKDFFEYFKEKYSKGFNIEKHLIKIGVVNQTTMLATETEEIASLLKQTMLEKYGIGKIDEHFADTRDTLCYATNDNQDATIELLYRDADFAIVVGGYNSSNTSHIVELCSDKLPTYFISSADKILDDININHFDLSIKKEITTENYLPPKDKIDILLTSGASCPDAEVESVLMKFLSMFDEVKPIDEVIKSLG
ncbi:MAG: 4-hydroxy-3-methylbut-2-enyl diphosphate reductase [Bacteroidetes bacterium]|nr:4-hydroxy-3-methylbut-2-enyl diphosphate reductase [Bacteroidota bacterium]MCH8170439.1 4-hydroxy-3-methylbut-2-enyl diphosphate reductase [Bacteroidota bacterium]MCH8941689.1 4-hydroxy-3-methylbut-2-enyl diphosphate reductase [Bacteroidota bacterium]